MPQTKLDAFSLFSDLQSLTALRPMLALPGIAALKACLAAACEKDMPRALERYHEMFYAMCKAPRLTGEAFRDYWLYGVMASSGLANAAVDDILVCALERDLSVVQLFCGIGGRGIWELLSRPAKPASANTPPDAIMRLSAQAWGGAASEQPKPHRQSPAPKAAEPAAPPLWQYGARAFSLDMCAGEDILELIDAFEREGDWPRLAHSVLALCAAHGDIALFSHRRMYYRAGALVPMKGGRAPEWGEFVGLEAAQEVLARKAGDFAAGRYADNVLLYGESGLGKTALAASLAEAFPLRLIVVRAEEFASMAGLLREAARAPMRFIVLVDDVDAVPGALLGYAAFEQSENIWLIATSRARTSHAAFPEQLLLEPPPLKAFIKRVMELARARGAEMDYDHVQDICIDWKVDGGDLTASAALKVLEKMTEG